jgi:hypothetical protein
MVPIYVYYQMKMNLTCKASQCPLLLFQVMDLPLNMEAVFLSICSILLRCLLTTYTPDL